MLLRLQKYSLQVKYKKGKDMHLADTLSRAYLPEVYACAFTRELEDIDHSSNWLPMSEDRWQELKNAAADDPVQQMLRAVIIQGWPENRADVPESVQPYFDVRDSLTIQDELVFKGQLLVVPTVMRKQMMEEIHATHIGIEELETSYIGLAWQQNSSSTSSSVTFVSPIAAVKGKSPSYSTSWSPVVQDTSSSCWLTTTAAVCN